MLYISFFLVFYFSMGENPRNWVFSFRSIFPRPSRTLFDQVLSDSILDTLVLWAGDQGLEQGLVSLMKLLMEGRNLLYLVSLESLAIPTQLLFLDLSFQFSLSLIAESLKRKVLFFSKMIFLMICRVMSEDESMFSSVFSLSLIWYPFFGPNSSLPVEGLLGFCPFTIFTNTFFSSSSPGSDFSRHFLGSSFGVLKSWIVVRSLSSIRSFISLKDLLSKEEFVLIYFSFYLIKLCEVEFFQLLYFYLFSGGTPPTFKMDLNLFGLELAALEGPYLHVTFFLFTFLDWYDDDGLLFPSPRALIYVLCMVCSSKLIVRNTYH